VHPQAIVAGDERSLLTVLRREHLWPELLGTAWVGFSLSGLAVSLAQASR